MAKNKEKEVVEGEDKAGNAVDQVLKKIRKEYGKTSIVGVEDIIDEQEKIVPISPTLDLITHGGVPSGSWVSISGAPKIGKTLCALTIAANAQKEAHGGRTVVYGHVEGRTRKMHVYGIDGLNKDSDKFILIQSTKEKILYAADYLNIFVDFLRNCPNVILIIDSLSALCDEKIASGGIGTETRGHGAKLISQFCDTVSNVVRINDSIVIGITHRIANTSGYGAFEIEKASRRWTYQSDIRLTAKKKEFWEEDGKIVGQKVSWLCECAALGPPGGETDSYIRYGIGLDKEYELIELGETLGVIEKGGAWYSFNPVDFGLTGDIVKIQGKPAMRKMLCEQKEVYGAIYKKVMESLKK